MSMTDRVLRHNKKLPKSRYSPYTIGTKEKQKQEQKEEAVRLGVELSLFLAEAMFLLSNDIRSMLYVFETYIKPKNGVYQDGGKSIQWDQFKLSSYYFAFGVRVLARIVSVLKTGGLVKPSGVERYKQELKKLEENLSYVKDVSKANGFAREAIESNILHFWKSLFETTPEMINPNKTIVLELFTPLLNEASRDACSRRLTSLRI
ncbi:PREDICTED: uncharacterized protein LOC104705051 [Camelina sativa]|uniref:Uncharacterized protein LOC104705051 n=1 Tax=Camelina sativa TaxID=90675 RepID=A0ABM0T195_CAMSA|nr:PREDICTED: uncharacterized protein LOC104705051 [Camelina sativa]